MKLSGGGGQRDGGLLGDVTLRPHRHDLQSREQSQRLPGDLLRRGAAKDGLHHQLQHVSPPHLQHLQKLVWLFLKT